MRLEERKQGLAWEIRTSEKVKGMDFGGGRRKVRLVGCIWALYCRRGILGAATRLIMHPTWAIYSYLPHPLRPPHSIRLQARVQARLSRQAAANHLPLALREIPPTPPRRHPVVHSGLCTRSSRDEENLVEDQSFE